MDPAVEHTHEVDLEPGLEGVDHLANVARIRHPAMISSVALSCRRLHLVVPRVCSRKPNASFPVASTARFAPSGRWAAPPSSSAKVAGAKVTDEDGRTYIDYVMSWGPLIHGHAPPELSRILATAARAGTSFGAPTAAEIDLARLVCRYLPSVDRVRFVNSGTEATMSAVRLARAATGRDLIIKFAGCYHGHADGFLVQAGSGATTLGVPTSPGVSSATAAETLIARYNDLDSVARLLRSHRRHVAAVIVEPVAGNMGVVPPRPGFLEGLRALTSSGTAAC